MSMSNGLLWTISTEAFPRPFISFSLMLGPFDGAVLLTIRLVA